MEKLRARIGLALIGIVAAAGLVALGRASTDVDGARDKGRAEGERAGVARGVVEGRALQVRPSGGRRSAFRAGYAAGADDVFGGYDGGWYLGRPYVVTLAKGRAPVSYRIDSRTPMRAGVAYFRCGPGRALSRATSVSVRSRRPVRLAEPADSDHHHLGALDRLLVLLGLAPEAHLAAADGNLRTAGDRERPSYGFVLDQYILRSSAPPMKLAPLRSSQDASLVVSFGQDMPPQESPEYVLTVAMIAQAPGGSVFWVTLTKLWVNPGFRSTGFAGKANVAPVAEQAARFRKQGAKKGRDAEYTPGFSWALTPRLCIVVPHRDAATRYESK